VVVSAANSAARKRSRPSSSAARDSRVPDKAPDGMPEGTVLSEGIAQENRNGASRAAKAREELAAVPSQESGDMAAADDLDADADIDDGDLDGAVDLEDFDDLADEDLGDDALGAEDLGVADAPDGGLAEADLGDEQEGEEPEPAAAAASATGNNAAPAEGKASGEGGDDEIFVFGDDDDDLPAAQVAVAGATADPVKDYLKQIGKVPLRDVQEAASHADPRTRASGAPLHKVEIAVSVSTGDDHSRDPAAGEPRHTPDVRALGRARGRSADHAGDCRDRGGTDRVRRPGDTARGPPQPVVRVRHRAVDLRPGE